MDKTFRLYNRLTYERHYLEYALFTADYDVSWIWCNMLGGRKGAFVNGKYTLMLPIKRELIEETLRTLEWAVKKTEEQNQSKSNKFSEKVILEIAKSKIDKIQESTKYKRMCIEMIERNVSKIIEMKMNSWKEVLEEQANQLPF